MKFDSTKPDTKKDMIYSGRKYGLTLNPAEQCRKGMKEQFIHSYSIFCIRLLKLKTVFPDVVLFPEYSPGKHMTNGKGSFKASIPRLHFHGECTVDPQVFYQFGIDRILSNNSYDISDKVDLEYATKNSCIMGNWCREYRVPYEITYQKLSKPSLLTRLKEWADRASTDDLRLSLTGVDSDDLFELE